MEILCIPRFLECHSRTAEFLSTSGNGYWQFTNRMHKTEWWFYILGSLFYKHTPAVTWEHIQVFRNSYRFSPLMNPQGFVIVSHQFLQHLDMSNRRNQKVWRRDSKQKEQGSRSRNRTVTTTLCNFPSAEHNRLDGRERKRNRKLSGEEATPWSPFIGSVVILQEIWSSFFFPFNLLCLNFPICKADYFI